MGEDAGLLVPTRYVFERAGYFDLIREEKITPAFLDESRKKVLVPISGMVHSSLLLPEEWVRADFKLSVPKLKGHSQTTITNSLKLTIGLVDRRERLVGHHYLLDEKIADVACACLPNVVITDAVVAGQGSTGFPQPYPLGILIIGKNPLAVDSVAAAILGYNPKSIGHLQAAYARGLGPIDLAEIALSGDVSLTDAQARARDFEKAPALTDRLNPLIRLFLGSIAGSEDNCIGGCVGLAIEAIHFINAYRVYKNGDILSKIVQRIVNPRSFKPRKIAVVVGDYRKPIPDHTGPLLLLGDCALVSPSYRHRIIKRIKGCPVFMGRSVFHFAQATGLTNPFLDVREGYPFLKNLITRTIKRGCASLEKYLKPQR